MSARPVEVGDLQRPLHGRRALGAGDAVQPGEHGQDLAAGQLDVEVVQLRDDAHRHPRRLGFLRQLEAEHRDRPLGRDRLRGQHPHRRRLAGAVGPEQPEADAVRHRQVEMVDGGQLTEALDDGAQFDRRRGGGLDHPVEDRRAASLPAGARTASGRPRADRRSPSRRHHLLAVAAAARELEQLRELGRDHDVPGQLDPALEVRLHRVEIAAGELQELDRVHRHGQLRLAALTLDGLDLALVDLQLVDVDAVVGTAGDAPPDRRRHVLGDLGIDLLGHLPEDPVERRLARRRAHQLLQSLRRRVLHDAAEAVGHVRGRVSRELAQLLQRPVGIESSEAAHRYHGTSWPMRASLDWPSWRVNLAAGDAAAAA